MTTKSSPYDDPEWVARYIHVGPPAFLPGHAGMLQMAGILLAERMPDDGRLLIVGAGGGLETRYLAGFAKGSCAPFRRARARLKTTPATNGRHADAEISCRRRSELRTPPVHGIMQADPYKSSGSQQLGGNRGLLIGLACCLTLSPVLARAVRGGIFGMHALAIALLLVPVSVFAQNSLRTQIADIAKDAKGVVGVACELPGTKLNCDLNSHIHAPMQSMYKLPLSLTALHLAEIGKLLPDQRSGESMEEILDRKVRFLPTDIIPHSYSPLTDRYPKADVDVTLREVIRLAVGVSDNGAEEILVRLVGGPLAVENYMHSLGINAIQVRYSERDLDRDENLEYQDWIEPTAAVELLERLVKYSPVSPAMNAFLLKTMADSLTGKEQLRAGLPPGTVLAHKTGHSGTHGGVTAATNDIGLVTLPDGRRLAIAVFVTDSRANDTTRQRVIARIAQAVYKEALAER